MAFDLHPILDKDVSPRPGLWYAVAPESAPAARVGATAIQAREAGAAFLCAGATPEGPFSDLYELKIGSDSVSWNSLPSLFLPPRYEHTLALTLNGGLLVFGGAQESGPLGDVWIYDRDSGEWQRIELASGVPPAPRTHHSSTSLWRDKLVIFSGGDSRTDTLDGSLHLFDIASSSWLCPDITGVPPSPRQGHISAVVGDTLYVHGGMVAGGDLFRDLYTLDLVKMHWSQPQLTGKAPPPLAAHGCAIIGTRLYIFGGLTTSGACDNLYCLDTETLTWCLVKVEGAPPPCRLDHAMTTISLLSKCNRIDVTLSPPTPSLQPLITPTTSQPHLVTVIDPETQIVIDGNTRNGEISGNSTRETLNDSVQDESSSPAQSEGVDPLLSSKSSQNESDIAVCMQKDSPSTSEVKVDREELRASGEEKQREMMKCDFETITGLLVFGGMDTSGHIHSDCFVIIPTFTTSL